MPVLVRMRSGVGVALRAVASHHVQLASRGIDEADVNRAGEARARQIAEQALKRLSAGTVKGKRVKVRLVQAA